MPPVAASDDDLERLFRPRAVAVAGASTNVDSPGQDYVRSLQVLGFAGPIYPINPKADEVAGLPAYPSLAEVPAGVDLVISCVPASAVLELVAQCGARAIPFLHLFTGRFSETGDEAAAELEQRLERRAREAGVRILGPNGLGIYHPAAGLAFRPDLPADAGQVAFLKACDFSADTRHAPDDLVTRHHRIDGIVPLAAHLMDVGVADAAEVDVDQHVSCSGFAPPKVKRR